MTGSPIAMHFGQKMQSKKELVDSEENMTKCLCPECPTNPEDGLFCVRGLTSKPIEQVRALGCDCALCSIIPWAQAFRMLPLPKQSHFSEIAKSSFRFTDIPLLYISILAFLCKLANLSSQEAISSSKCQLLFWRLKSEVMLAWGFSYLPFSASSVSITSNPLFSPHKGFRKEMATRVLCAVCFWSTWFRGIVLFFFYSGFHHVQSN